jgi:hypothetical protein
MELDDLKTRWQELDRKLDANLRLNTRLVRTAVLARTETSLRWLTWRTIAGLILKIALVLLIGSFLADHIRDIRFAAPALVLHVSAIALLGASIHQIVTLHSIDYGEPVLAIQKKLETLRISRIRETKWTLFASPLLWAALVIVVAKAAGIDLWSAGLRDWIIANFLFGVAFLGAMVWIARHVSVQSEFMRRLLDDIAGRTLTRARASLASLDEFERE